MLTALLVVVALVVAWLALAAWYAHSTPHEVPCTLDLEATQAHFHAHVQLPDTTLIEPGDTVLVHGAPTRIPHGTQTTMTATATVWPASWLKRQFVRLTGGTAIHELYEVGFEG